MKTLRSITCGLLLALPLFLVTGCALAIDRSPNAAFYHDAYRGGHYDHYGYYRRPVVVEPARPFVIER